MEEPIVLHLARADEETAHMQALVDADLIVAQATADSFSPTHLASSEVRRLFADKTIVWPNCFYSGQQPYLRYFTHPKLGRLMGPWEALHDLRLHRSWVETGRVQPDSFFERDENFERSVSRSSFEALKEREARCDVRISDFVEEHTGTEKLFFTFNHPTSIVLEELANRVTALAGIRRDEHEVKQEPLGRYRVPSTWSDPASLQLQGDDWSLNDDGFAQVAPGLPNVFTLEQICDDFTTVYDSSPTFKTMEGVRLTPNIGL